MTKLSDETLQVCWQKSRQIHLVRYRPQHNDRRLDLHYPKLAAVHV